MGESFLEHRERERLYAEKLRLEAEADADRLETVARQAVALITDASSSEELKQRIRSEFMADPYRPLASYLSEDERAEAARIWFADHHAYAELCLLNSSRVFRTVLQITRNAQDAVQLCRYAVAQKTK